MDKQMTNLERKWYEELLEDCQNIITEAVFTSSWALIQGYHELGSRINTDTHNFERQEVYGKKIAKRIAESLGKSERTINYAIAFATKFPQLDSFPSGKDMSWRRIIQEELTEGETKEKLHKYCPDCGSDLTERTLRRGK